MVGKVWIVGVGPGDPELLTLKAKKILEESEVIFYPVKRRGADSFALSVVSKVVKLDRKELIELLFPMTTKTEKLKPFWQKAVEKVIRKSKVERKRCAVVVEGDPLLYSTTNHILKMLCEEVEVEVVPGISSFQLMACALKEPVATDDEVVVICSPTFREQSGCRSAKLRDDFDRIVQVADSIFIFKSGKVLGELFEFLSKNSSFNSWFGQMIGTDEQILERFSSETLQKPTKYFSMLFLKKRKG